VQEYLPFCSHVNFYIDTQRLRNDTLIVESHVKTLKRMVEYLGCWMHIYFCLNLFAWKNWPSQC